MIQPEFFLQLLIVLLNLPTTLRQTYHATESVGLRQIAEEVFGRFFLQLRPFHQQPYFFMRWFATHETMRGLYPHSHKTRFQPSLRTLPPANRLPNLLLSQPPLVPR